MSKFGLYPTDLKMSCSTFQCYERAEYFLGMEDGPGGTTTIICGQCASELKEQLTSELVETVAEPVIETLTNAELKKVADEKGIEVSSKATKAKLIAAIKEAE